MANELHRIANGSSKFQLMASLFGESLPSQNRPYAMFTLDSKEQIEVYIDAMEREDGSGESWNFKGYVPKFNVPNTSCGNIAGYYSSKTRTGTFKRL